MGLKLEIPVFVETNLGTRIAIPVSHDITIANLKREIERAHIDIFPELGFVNIPALMIKRDSQFYHIPDSIFLKQDFRIFQNFWLLHADASLPEVVEKTSLSRNVVSEKGVNFVHIHNGKKVNKKYRQRTFWCLKAILLGLVKTVLLRNKTRKTRHLERSLPKKSFSRRHGCASLRLQGLDEKGRFQQEVLDPAQLSDSGAVAETTCESSSGGISVSRIIDRYYKDFIEVGHVESAFCSKVSSRFEQSLVEGERVINISSNDKKQDSLCKARHTILCSPLPEESRSVGLRAYERSEVGKRLVAASKSLSQCQNSQGSSLSNGKRLWNPDASSVIRNLVFEIDSD